MAAQDEEQQPSRTVDAHQRTAAFPSRPTDGAELCMTAVVRFSPGCRSRISALLLELLDVREKKEG